MRATRSQRVVWAGALVAVAAVWGLTFTTVKEAVSTYPVLAFLGWRFAIAVVAFVAIFPGALRRFDRRVAIVGGVAGVFLGTAYVLQTLGLRLMDHNAASRAGFITGMFVVITPVLQALVLRKRPRAVTVAGVAAATIGLWLLSGDGSAGFGLADALVLGCAVAYSAQLIVIAGWAHDADVGALTLTQLVVAAVGCGVAAALFQPAAVPTGVGLWVALLVTGLLASAVAFWVQTASLRHISPTGVALILIMEPVFAGFFGAVLRGERLGPAGWAGSALILSGMVLGEVVGPWLRGRGAGGADDSSLERLVPDGPPPSAPLDPDEAAAVEAERAL